MKKTYSFLLMLALAGSARSQQQPTHFSELAKHPEMMTPALARSIFKFGVDEKGYLPPVSPVMYNLLDSSYYYTWDALGNEWENKGRTYFNNDCELGKPLSRLVKESNLLAPDQFDPVLLEQWTYFSDGNTKTDRVFEKYQNTGEWIFIGFDSLIGPNLSVDDWSKSWSPADGAFTYGYRSLDSWGTNDELLVHENQIWDVPQQAWKPLDNNTYTYENGNNILYEEGDWDETTNQWVPTQRFVNTFDANGNLLETLISYLYNGIYEPTQRVTYTYDANGNNLTQLWESYDNGTGQYKPTRRKNTTYNAGDQPTYWLVEQYNAGGWVNYDKMEITYHSNGNVATHMAYMWVDFNQDWILTQSDSILANGNYMTYIIKFTYDPAVGGFQFGYLINYEYNAEGLTSQIFFDILEANSLDTWVPSNKATFEYDANGRNLETVNYTYSLNIGDYERSIKEHFYNTGCLFSGTGDQLDAQTPCTHANPIKPGQPIHCTGPLGEGPAQLELYSLDGKRVHAQSFNPEDGIRLERPLPNGLYLLLLHGQQGAIHRSKVVVME